EVRNDGDPAPRTEMLGDGLRVMAAAAAFEPMEDDQRRRVRGVRQLLPVLGLYPSAGCVAPQLRMRRNDPAIVLAVRELPRTRPIEIEKVAVRCIDTLPDE